MPGGDDRVWESGIWVCVREVPEKRQLQREKQLEICRAAPLSLRLTSYLTHTCQETTKARGKTAGQEQEEQSFIRGKKQFVFPPATV